MKNLYKHTVDLKKIKIENCNREEFAEKIIALPYRGYEVEDISDGRKIVITKPGGKRTFGRIAKNDILVFIFNPQDNSLWQISHQQILKDLTSKSETNKKEIANIIEVFERTFNGEEPDIFLHKYNFSNIEGESVEALVKAYKWIWGQEDVNYPNGEGRMMSFKEILELKKKIENE
ncbi:MAG: hypothetical protein KAV44_06275 [Bacteroidales bacterium]|jgi:hypothetical protein|nr:hypothetical protein [Bacteroidales bacterium]